MTTLIGTGAAMAVEDLTAMRIGHHVRTIRERIDMATDELAHRIGIAPVVVASIEDGVRLPTIELLYRLAAGLGVGPGELLPGPDEHPRIQVHLPITEAPDSPTGQIVGGGPGNPVQTYLFEMAAGTSDEGFGAHRGEELVMVMQGEVIISTLGGDDAVVTAGQSHSIVTHVPHAVRIGDAGPARFMVISTDA